MCERVLEISRNFRRFAFGKFANSHKKLEEQGSSIMDCKACEGKRSNSKNTTFYETDDNTETVAAIQRLQ